ncbi:MAG TPA: PAS domain-containing sensor histidine kinase [Prolixibacteraceae bacterium]|nr:PAS domain-containing sensor histidine kinase [Prolixibacteraceae bacterium]
MKKIPIDFPTPEKVFIHEFISTFEFYSQIIDSLQDYSIFTTDKELRINSWNEGSTKMFGFKNEEVIGKHFEIIYTEEDRKKDITKTKIETALNEGRVADYRWGVHKDGSRFYAYEVIFPLRGKDGELLGFVKILRDLTERQKAEEAIQKYVKELEELNTHKENILAILSHDLRSPLSGIIQMAELLKDDYKTMEDDQLKSLLDHQYELAKSELEMLDYLVEWARIKYASEVFTPKQIHLLPYVKKVFDILSEVAAKAFVSLHLEIEENIHVFADEKMLLSILQNLVSNAIKHSIKGEGVTVAAKQMEDMILVQVKDTGIGMSKKTQEKLFIPQMTDLLNARKDDKGAGIGLLLVKGFVEKNGGEIYFESVKGEGTSFYFTLPIENRDSVD